MIAAISEWVRIVMIVPGQEKDDDYRDRAHQRRTDGDKVRCHLNGYARDR
jgi:hypothetical protein